MTDVSPAVLERAHRRVGTSLRGDKYALTALLGAGSASAVYEAAHRSGSRVAIKILHEELSRRDELRARFLREGYVANKVQHKGLVRVLDDDVDDDGTTFLVMELLKGLTLKAEVEGGRHALGATRVVDIALALLDVLEAVHAAGVVHGDIKPENLFFTTAGHLKLLELGIARLLLEERMASGTKIIGTPELVAPEQAAGRVREIDRRTDLYSVGALMFTLLSGRGVHEARTPKEAMAAAASRPVRPLREAWPGVPSALAQVVDVALCFEKERRWSSAAEMRAALEHAVRFASRLPSAPRPESPPPSRRGGKAGHAPPPPSAVPMPLVKKGRKPR